ncbi:MAG: hypothetical protein QXP27_07035 [Candidatus Methanomethyliaceae archaeon]
MGSTATPAIWQDGGDEIAYQFGWLDEKNGKSVGLIYGINITKVQQMVAAGNTNYYPAAYLWNGQPIQLPAIPRDEAHSGGAGVSISPDGKWLAVGWGEDIYVLPRPTLDPVTRPTYANGGRVSWQKIKIPGNLASNVGNPPNVSSSPAFFWDDGHLWVAVGSWSGGLATGYLDGTGVWKSGTHYLTTDTDPNAKWGAITSSPSWDPEAIYPGTQNDGTLYFAVNNTNSQGPYGDNVFGWAVGFDPVTGKNYSIGYTVPGGLPGSGDLTWAPCDSSVLVSPTGQSLFIPQRDGTVYWYPAAPPRILSNGYDFYGAIWSSDANYDPNNPSTWDISNLALAPDSLGGGRWTLFRVPEFRNAVDEAVIQWSNNNPTFQDFAAVGKQFQGWIDPSAVKIGSNIELLSNTENTVLYAPLDADGHISSAAKQVTYQVPPGVSIPDFASAVPFPNGGMAVWTYKGLMIWVPGPYTIFVVAYPNPTTIGAAETAYVTVPDPDTAPDVFASLKGRQFRANGTRKGSHLKNRLSGTLRLQNQRPGGVGGC